MHGSYHPSGSYQPGFLYIIIELLQCNYSFRVYSICRRHRSSDVQSNI